MANMWTPGKKQQQKGKKNTDGLDDLLGDLLDEDVTPKKKSIPSYPAPARPRSADLKKQGSRDEDFYSNIQASAEDGLSDVSEADVKEMAQSIKDLEDMDADLFGGKLKKKGSTKGGGSSKTNTPRRGGTPRSRSTTPRAGSPQQRVTSPGARVTSPVSKNPLGNSAPSPSWNDQPTSPRGSISRDRPGSGGSRTTPSAGVTWGDQQTSPRGVSRDRPGSGGKTRSPAPTTQPDYSIPKPSTAPGKFSEIGSGSDNLKPGGAAPTERPGTVPKAKPKYDFGEFDEDDPLAGLLSDDEDDDDSWATKPKRSSVKKKEEPVQKKPDPEPVKTIEEPKKNLFDRPPTRSGVDKVMDDEPVSAVAKMAAAAAATKKKEEPGIFSDDDDFLGGLGIEDKGNAKPVSKPVAEMEDFDAEDKPSRMFDQLLGKDSNVSKHLEAKERKDFVLDKKYTQPPEEEEEDYAFGSYMPSAAGSTSGSRPGSRRSVRFQDEDDIFGFDKPPSRGRSPASKKPEGMEWLDHMSPRTTPTKETVAKEETVSKPPVKETPALKDNVTKEPAPISTPAKSPAKTMNKPKVDPFEYLGLKEDDNDGFEWMKPKQTDSRPHTGELRQKDATMTQPPVVTPEQPRVEKKTPDPLKIDQSPDDYLGLGGEVDLDSMLKKKPDSPLFGGSRVSAEPEKDPFSTPATAEHSILKSSNRPMWESSSRRRNSRSGSTDKSVDFILPKETPAGSNDPIPSQLQQQNNQSDFLSSKPDPAFMSSGQETSYMSKEPDFLSSKPAEAKTTDFFSFSAAEKQKQREIRTQMGPEKPSDQMAQQQAQMQAFIQLQQQYQQLVQSQPSPALPTQTRMPYSASFTAGLDPDAKVRKLEIEIDCLNSLLESTKKRHLDEIKDIESSYNTRLHMLEETHSSKEKRLREENEHLMSQNLTKLRTIEEQKSDIISQNYKKIEEIEREKMEEVNRIKEIHRNAIEQLRKDHEESLHRLKSAKDSQIEAVAVSHDTTKSLAVAVELIQNNARDVGELQKKLDHWHSMGMDEREIAIRSKDEQLKILQERLRKQQDDNDNERKRLEDLITRLETQIREQSRVHDEERWNLKQEQNRLQSLQTTLEEERKLWTEQQARERSNIEKIRESLLEEQKSVLSQLHRERQALAEERTQFMVTQKTRRDDLENYTVKLSQAKTEFDAIMKAISDEKNKSYNRKEELAKEEQRIEEERTKLQTEKVKQKAKEEELIDNAQIIKEKSEQVDEYYLEANSKFEEGMMALEQAQRIEAEENQRLDKISKQMQAMQNKEKEIAEERLRLSKEKKEVENLRSAGLCPNCRSPISGSSAVVHANGHVPNSMMNGHFPGVPSTTYQPTSRPNSGHISLSTVAESIKADRSIRMWKAEAFKDQKYLEEQSLFLYSLKQMPYSNN